MKILIIISLLFCVIGINAQNYTQKKVNVGLTPNDKTGDPLRTAMQKLNSNDSALFVETDMLFDSVSNLRTSKADLNSPTFSGTVSGINATMVGLGNVNNTSDINKPVSTATQSALDAKANINSPTFTGTVNGITATMVGAMSTSHPANVITGLGEGVSTVVARTDDTKFTVLDQHASTLSDTTITHRTEINNLWKVLNSFIDSIRNGSIIIGPTPTIEEADYYVATNGNDTWPGTISQPFKSIEHACAVAVAGDLIYVRGGTYYPLTLNVDLCMNLTNVNDGTEANPIRIYNYPGETPIINLSTTIGDGNSYAGFKFTGDWWHWKGFSVTGMPNIAVSAVSQSFWFNNCNNTIIENCNVYDNYSMGFVLGGQGLSGHNNRIINCDFYRNHDSNTTSDPNGNADGLHITIADSTAINYVEGCRFWENSDDGFDSFNTPGTVYLTNCWSYRNGYVVGTNTRAGDGNGYKFGQTLYHSQLTKRVVKNCIASGNYGHGFDGNFQTGDAYAVSFINCLAYNNGPTHNGYGFRLAIDDVPHLMRNNISYGNQYTAYIGTSGIHDHNTWDSSVTVNSSDFISLDETQLILARNSNGTLPIISFGKLADGSDLINAGTSIPGMSYLGTSPDMGAFEKQ